MLETISINPSSEVPLFKQLVEQLRGLMATGILQPGDDIPSVRALARHLGINPMTVSKAISQLTSEGWLSHQRGQSCRVADTLPFSDTTKSEWLTRAAAELIARARQLRLSKKQLNALINDLWQEDTP